MRVTRTFGASFLFGCFVATERVKGPVGARRGNFQKLDAGGSTLKQRIVSQTIYFRL